MAVNVEYEIIEKEKKNLIDLEFLKSYLRINHDYDDGLIKMLLDSAIETAEGFLNMGINPALVKAIIPKVSKSSYLPCRPISSVKSAMLKIDDIDTDVVDRLKFKCDQGKILCFDESLIGYKLEIIYTAGYEKQIPPSLCNGLLQLVRWQYESEANERINPGVLNDIFYSYRRLKI